MHAKHHDVGLILTFFRAGAIRTGRATNLQMGTKFNKDRKMRVAVVGGGPSGACAAEIFAQVCKSCLVLIFLISLAMMLVNQQRKRKMFSE